MKISAKKIVSVLIAALMVLQATVLLVGCNPKIDNETSPLVISTEAVDGVFNPFAYTSGADGGIVSETQLGMLNIDKDGKVVAGWDQPTVAQAYSVITTGSESDYQQDGNYSNYYTDYYFAIKDGIKFSDGVDLTIKDVLFNMYVYLDPVYTGSSTMYSINIQGLSAYRTQSEDENAQSQLNQAAMNNALMRRDRLLAWCNDTAKTPLDDYFSDKTELEEVKADIEKIQTLFKEELNSDWTSAASGIEEYEKYYLKSAATDAITTGAAWKEYTKEGNKNKRISEQWEVFLLMYGEISTSVQKLSDGTKKYTFEYNGSDKYDHSKDSLVNRVYANFMTEGSANFRTKLADVITQYATANTYFEYIMASEKSKLLNDGEHEFDSISGITVLNADSIPQANGQPINLGGKRDILKIRINGVDPKAILSFSFSVAPMHYYSTPKAIAEFKELPSTTDDEGNTVRNFTGFGVEYSDQKFMNTINTNLVPRGAGPYRASNGTVQGTADDAVVPRTDFNNNDTLINFERNNYFSTVMENGTNAKIKFLRYKVISAASMKDAVTGRNKEVYISMPNATKDIYDEVRNLDGVKCILVDNMGYGYIGINASYVKDLNVRRAIMSAMDVTLCRSYYGSDELVEILYRSMSKNSWAYPQAATAYYPYDPTGITSLEYAQEAGYYVNSETGILTNDAGERLQFTFTVAGETEDHPAYQTMEKAKEILNNIGFDITVTKDTQALSKLANGQLEVWAAAWSSAVDPDMYQVYHKDSTASSVKNWGYPYLLRDGTAEELEIIDQLADQIEKGRKYLLNDERKQYYETALNLVMELAVELPTYQRKNMYLINTQVIDENTLTEATVYQSPISQIWNISFING